MSSRGYTDIGGTGEAFLTTHWSLVEGAAGEGEDRDPALIELLLRRYWKPVYCYLRRTGVDNEEAKDLTQGFFHEIVLEQGLLKKADAAKGRFRSLLLIALNRYVRDVRDKACAQKRRPQGGWVSLDSEDIPDLPAPLSQSSPENTYHYAWVAGMLERVLEEVKRQCSEEDKHVHWCVFRDRVLDPIMGSTQPPTLKEVMQRYDIASPSKASNMIVTVKRRFQTTLKRTIRDSVVSDDAVQQEWEHISQYFPKMAQDSA